MSRTNRLFRRALPIALVALLAVVASGCDWAQSPAATVKGDGHTLTVSGSQFRDLLTLGKGETLTDTSGAKIDHVPLSDAAGLLSLRIRYGYFLDEAERRHLTISDTDVKNAKQVVAQDATAGRIPKRFQTWLARALAAQGAVANDITAHADPAEVERASRALFAQVGSSQDQTCAEVFYSLDKDVATAAATSIRGGTSFSDAGAAAAKTDPDAQGSPSAECLTGAQLASAPQPLIDELTNAKLNEVDGPVTITQGATTVYYIVRVTSRKHATYESLKSQLDAEYGNTEAANQQTAFLQKARVTIDPRYGTWDKTTQQVTAPDGLPSKFAKLLDETTSSVTGGATTAAP